MNANCVTFAIKATDQSHLISDDLRTQQTSIFRRKTRSDAFFFSPRISIRYQNRNAVFHFDTVARQVKRKDCFVYLALRSICQQKSALINWPIIFTVKVKTKKVSGRNKMLTFLRSLYRLWKM